MHLQLEKITPALMDYLILSLFLAFERMKQDYMKFKWQYMNNEFMIIWLPSLGKKACLEGWFLQDFLLVSLFILYTVSGDTYMYCVMKFCIISVLISIYTFTFMCIHFFWRCIHPDLQERQ